MKRILFLTFAFFLAGCAEQQVQLVEPHERTLYEQGLDFFTESKFPEAEKSLTELLQQYPGTRWMASVNYHLGYALEMQQKYQAAVDRYNKVVEYYQGLPSREAAEALYRLSICYEAISDDARTIFALNQLKPNLKYLSKDIADTEWPARLAAAYARSGNQEQALEYYNKAEAGLKKIRRGTFLDSARWLPKTFYSMGHVPDQRLDFKTQEDFVKFLSGLETSQIWLLRAVEAKTTPWNEKAANEITQIYLLAYKFIDQLPLGENKDKMLALKKKQGEQKALAARIDTLLDNLKTEKTWADDKVATAMWSDLKSVQKRIDLLLRQRDVRDRDIRQVPKYRGRIKDNG